MTTTATTEEILYAVRVSVGFDMEFPIEGVTLAEATEAYHAIVAQAIAQGHKNTFQHKKIVILSTEALGDGFYGRASQGGQQTILYWDGRVTDGSEWQ